MEPGREILYGNLQIAAHYDAPEGRTQVVEVDAAVLADLQVRRRQPGDRLEPLGMEGTKKLQDLFVDEKVPREERAHSALLGIPEPGELARLESLLAAQPDHQH